MAHRKPGDRRPATHAASDQEVAAKLHEAGSLYETYLREAELARIPTDVELQAWEARWQEAEQHGGPIGLVFES